MIHLLLKTLFQKNSSENEIEKSKLAFQEMKGYFNYLSKANEELDKKIFTLFSSISIVLAILGFFGIDFDIGMTCITKILLSILTIVFLYFCIWSFLGLFPRDAHYPYDGTYEGARKIFIDKPHLSDAYDQIIVNYEVNIKTIQEINGIKYKALIHAFVAYLSILILSIIIILFQ